MHQAEHPQLTLLSHVAVFLYSFLFIFSLWFTLSLQVFTHALNSHTNTHTMVRGFPRDTIVCAVSMRDLLKGLWCDITHVALLIQMPAIGGGGKVGALLAQVSNMIATRLQLQRKSQGISNRCKLC